MLFVVLCVFLFVPCQAILPHGFQNPLSTRSFSVPDGFPIRPPPASTVFFETSEGVGVNIPSQEENIVCQCNSYECECQKECFCKIVDGQSFKNKKGIETWPVGFPANADEPKDSSEDEGEDPSSTGPSVFKCGCDFNGQDVEVSPESGLDCDCSATRCKCTKKCFCQAKPHDAASEFGTSHAHHKTEHKKGNKKPLKSKLLEKLESEWAGKEIDVDENAVVEE